MKFTRRDFLAAGAVTAGLGALGMWATRGGSRAASAGPGVGYGPLVPDPAGLIDLPRGFAYTRFSDTGQDMSDGLLVPGRHDGMAAFEGPQGETILVRNHELDLRPPGAFGGTVSAAAAGPMPQPDAPSRLSDEQRRRLYDAGRGGPICLGGTTTVRFNTKTQAPGAEWLSLGGTLRNCAGGPTPWGTWLTCEEAPALANEVFAQDHGWVFEVPVTHEPLLHAARPLRAMGRFNHEAAAVDPKSGAVYMTEDRGDSLLYRFLPTKPGELALGGKLQALVVEGRPGVATSNSGEVSFPVGEAFPCTWIDLDEVEAPKDDLRVRGRAAGAATFVRGEGLWWGHGAAFFAATAGGEAQRGQVWRYTPDADTARGSLTLLVEPNEPTLLDNVDNLCVSPWGDLFACEDGGEGNGIAGITPTGEIYRFAWNRLNASEFAGVCVSPDASTLFVNVQSPGFTLAITGPWV